MAKTWSTRVFFVDGSVVNQKIWTTKKQVHKVARKLAMKQIPFLGNPVKIVVSGG